jgi:hypothetical protein
MTVATARAQDQKGWVNVNFGVAASGAGSETFIFTDLLFSEPFAMASAYPKPSQGAEFDFGGGFMFTPRVGLGVSFTGISHKDGAGLAVTVPHPFTFNASDTDAAPTQELLQRTEGAAHIELMLVPVQSERFQFRAFAGPSYFRYQADMVRDIEYSQVAPLFTRLNLVTITGYEAIETEGTGWGFHAGADASWFFTRVVGIGGFGRFSRGTASIDEPMSEVSQDVKVGGFQGGGGLRLRF